MDNDHGARKLSHLIVPTDNIIPKNIKHDNYDFTGEIRNTKCYHCEKEVSLIVVAITSVTATNPLLSPVPIEWYWCPSCGYPSSSIYKIFLPSSKGGHMVKGLPNEIQEIYDEIRCAAGVNAYRACDMLCRKILMHIAVEKGAKKGESFSSYVDYLANTHTISEPMKPWVDMIRKHGNEQAHEIKTRDLESSRKTLQFTTLLLETVYEADYIMNSK